MPAGLGSLALVLLGQALGLPHSNVSLSQPLARFDDLDHVDELLEEHDGEADTSDDPRPEAVHLVGTRQLERRGAVGAGEDLPQQCLVDLRSRLDIIYERSLQKSRGECGRGEGEQIQRDEEELVQGAADEEERL